MKTNILLLFVWMGLLTACNSIDDVLKPSDDIYISILETQDTVRVVPGDTISFHFMVTTNNGSVRRVEVLANDALFEGHPEKMTCGGMQRLRKPQSLSRTHMSRPPLPFRKS